MREDLVKRGEAVGRGRRECERREEEAMGIGSILIGRSRFELGGLRRNGGLTWIGKKSRELIVCYRKGTLSARTAQSCKLYGFSTTPL